MLLFIRMITGREGGKNGLWSKRNGGEKDRLIVVLWHVSTIGQLCHSPREVREVPALEVESYQQETLYKNLIIIIIV